MKKIHKKLALSAETVRTLSEPELVRALGGADGTMIVVGPITSSSKSIFDGGCKLPTTGTIAISLACGGGGGGTLGGG